LTKPAGRSASGSVIAVSTGLPALRTAQPSGASTCGSARDPGAPATSCKTKIGHRINGDVFTGSQVGFAPTPWVWAQSGWFGV